VFVDRTNSDRYANQSFTFYIQVTVFLNSGDHYPCILFIKKKNAQSVFMKD
jgi:hypothetical protein